MLDPDPAREADEDLPQPHRREHPRLRRAAGPVLALVVAVGVVAALITLRSSSNEHPNAARTTVRTVSPDVSPTESSAPPVTGGQDPASCPSKVSCITSATVPRQVLAAMRAVLPGARQQYATSVLTHRDGPGSQLWFRRVDVIRHRFHIVVVVQQSSAVDDPRSESDDDGSRSHTVVGRVTHGLSIRVQADGPSGLSIGLAEIQRLATDRRLLVVA